MGISESSAPSIPESGGLFPESIVSPKSPRPIRSVNRIIAYVGAGDNRYIATQYMLNVNLKLLKAKRFEEIGNYDLAIEIYKDLGETKEVSRIKKLKAKKKPEKTTSKASKKTASKKKEFSGKGDPPVEGGVRTLCYLISLLFPLGGIIIGMIYYGKPEPWHKEFGKTCLKIAVLVIIIPLLLGMGIIFTILLASA